MSEENESDKPFVCQVPGCRQRFANDDHLVIHQQKHELSLKLGTKTGEVLLVDQTPTPTRFLRNCEETGLFQELEANPFEQDFKHAASENSSNAAILGAKESEANEKSGKGGRVMLASAAVPVAPPPSLANPQKQVPMASAPAHVGTASAFTKQKLLASIQSKQQQQPQSDESMVLSQALKTAMENSTESDSHVFTAPHQVPRRRGRRPEEDDPEEKRVRFLERNRAAASRCRARKKLWVDNLEKKAKELEILNTSLQQEVIMLRAEVQQLKTILIAHKDCPLIAGAQQRKPGEQVPPSISTVGITLLSQLASLPALSPLLGSPPSLGSGAAILSSPILLSSIPGATTATDAAKSMEVPVNAPGAHNIPPD